MAEFPAAANRRPRTHHVPDPTFPEQTPSEFRESYRRKYGVGRRLGDGQATNYDSNYIMRKVGFGLSIAVIGLAAYRLYNNLGDVDGSS